MINKNCYAVLMAGGLGTRFWPYSREKKPKQFLDVLGTGKTLIQSTYERFLSSCLQENIFVVTQQDHVALVQQQLPLKNEQILAEPVGRNTAPCIAYACYKIAKKNPQAVVIVSPADHIILHENKFQDAIQATTDYTTTHDELITIGIPPMRPETGYGYIQYKKGSLESIKKVLTFTEKPSLELAKQFIRRGNFVWNSGIFVWGVQTIVSAMRKYQPKISSLFEQASDVFYTPDEKAVLYDVYKQCDSISIDYGIMEKADNVSVYLGEFSWSDLGAWDSLHTTREKNEDNNVIDANAMTYDVKNSILIGSKNKLIVSEGLDGYLVGEFDDVIIVCKKNNEQFFRDLVRKLKQSNESSRYL